MQIDARGLSHPEHIKKFKTAIDGMCAVYEDIEIMLDSKQNDIKRFEMYIRSCGCKYEKLSVDNYIKIHIKAPFSMCG